MTNGKRQTILGSGGSIGTDLAKSLRGYTDRVRLVSRHPREVHPGDELLPCDLTRERDLAKALENTEIAYLTIGFPYKTRKWKELWPGLMRSVVRLCSQQNIKLVFFDNMYMYDEKYMDNMTENTPVNPTSKKGQIRAEVADILLNAIEKKQVEGLIARSADFYGPGISNSLVLETVYKNLESQKKAIWFCSDKNLHNFTYTPDAGKATALLGNTSSAYGQVWHVPSSRPMTGSEWIRAFAKHLGLGTEPRQQVVSKYIIRGMGLFNPVMKELSELLYQWDRDYYFNSSKFEETFRYTPTLPEEAINAIVNAGTGHPKDEKQGNR